MPLPPIQDTSTCLVTGASSGIGAEIARQLAARRRGVTLVARREDRLKALADELAATGVRAEVLACDVSDAGARAELPDRIEDLGLTVDVLVNNAGLTTMGPVHRSHRDQELTLVRTDVEAVVDLCCLFVPPMATRRRGAVLNTASTAAFQPLPGQAAYGGAKAFVLSYSQAIRAELSGVGVSVTVLCPGPVETGFAETAGMTDAEASQALPKFMWVPAAGVAAAAVEGLEQGKAVVIPGMVNRFTAHLAHHAPRALVTSVVARQHPALKDGA
jgi:short-subunit dehydrogenase